eukprot:3268493-Prorocentrum_lima.AAC.1
MGEEVYRLGGEPLRRQLEGKVLQREGAAEEECSGGVRERRGDVHEKEPPGVGAKVAAINPDA